MRIYSYIMAMPDDIDVIFDALNSLATFSDRIYLIDGGMTQGTLCHHPRFTTPLRDVLYDWVGYCQFFTHGNQKGFEEYTGIWGRNNVEFVLWEHPFLDPGSQRNWIIKAMESEPEQPDWVCWIDSDEVCSTQMEDGIRAYLSALKPEQTNVVMQWLNLCQDERHMAGGNHSSWLAHGRAYRPGTVYWNAGWHEHQYWQGERVQWDVRVVHTRALYRGRLLVQRGHPRVGGTDNPLWGDVKYLEPVPVGVSWSPLHWPESEHVIPFEEDARNYWSIP